MEKIITGVIGAGASHDCIVPHSGRERRKGLEIPLTDELFSPQGYQEITDRYLASAEEGHIYRRRRRADPNITLEGYLKQRLASSDSSIKRGAREIPLYLRELIGTLGRDILKEQGRTGYSDLVDWLSTSGWSKIVILTTNWDVLLDAALQNRTGMRFPPHDLNSYIGHLDKWYLVKFHGSVNWVKRIPRVGFGVKEGMSELDIMLSLDIEQRRYQDAPIQFLNNFSYTNGTEYFYPIMGVPSEDKKIHLCPDSHLEAIKSIVNECEDFLVIGNSLKDTDVVDYLKENAQSAKRLTLVDAVVGKQGPWPHFEMRLQKVFPHATLEKSYQGFCQFVEGLDR